MQKMHYQNKMIQLIYLVISNPPPIHTNPLPNKIYISPYGKIRLGLASTARELTHSSPTYSQNLRGMFPPNLALCGTQVPLNPSPWFTFLPILSNPSLKILPSMKTLSICGPSSMRCKSLSPPSNLWLISVSSSSFPKAPPNIHQYMQYYETWL